VPRAEHFLRLFGALFSQAARPPAARGGAWQPGGRAGTDRRACCGVSSADL